MTKTAIALNAIRGTRLSRRAHIDIMETVRTLKLTTDEAVDLRREVVREWTTAPHDTDLSEVLGLAKTVVNTYARDVSYR